MLNRQQPPSYATVSDLALPQPKEMVLPNGLPMFILNAGLQPLVRVELIFPAGTKHQSKALVASATNALMREGTTHRKAAALSEALDFYGAYLEHETTSDHGSIILYSLNRHLANTLPLLVEIINEPAFEEDELELYRDQTYQRYLVRQERVNDLAGAHFQEMLFGPENFYGRKTQAKDYAALDRSSMVSFHAEHYLGGGATVLVAGLVSDDETKILSEHLSRLIAYGGEKPKPQLIFSEPAIKQQRLEKAGALQHALRVGRPLFSKTHPDFPAMEVVNTLLGGYFGSRLMRNIREDKGYTYGIGSGVVSKLQHGFFYVSTEVGAEVSEAALEEVYAEMDRMRMEPVTQDELDLVRNYLLGQFLRSVDGPFALAQKFAAVHLYGLDNGYYDHYLSVIKNITPEAIQALAERYFRREDLLELVVGPK